MEVILNKKSIKSTVKILVAICICFFVYSKIDLQFLIQIIHSVSWKYLLISTILFAVSKIIASIRLGLFLNFIDVPISQFANLKLYILGMYYNLFLPGGIGGDGYKIYKLNKALGTSIKPLTLTLLIDRISGLHSLVLLIAILGTSIEPHIFYIPELFIIGAILSWAFMFIMAQVFHMKTYIKIYLITFPLSILVQLSQVISIICIILAFGVKTNLINYALVFLATSVASIVPITPGGVGLRELVFQYGAQILNYQKDVGVASGSMFFIITVLVSFIGIYYHFFQEKIKL